MSQLRSEINVTPLVDVCLVLLIIFMVVTPMLGSGMPVNLPKTSRPETVPEGRNQLTITILSNQEIFLDQNWCPRDQLEARLRSMNEQHPGRDVRIKADLSLRYALVRDVMKTVSAVGYEKAGLVTQRKET